MNILFSLRFHFWYVTSNKLVEKISDKWKEVEPTDDELSQIVKKDLLQSKLAPQILQLLTVLWKKSKNTLLCYTSIAVCCLSLFKIGDFKRAGLVCLLKNVCLPSLLWGIFGDFFTYALKTNKMAVRVLHSVLRLEIRSRESFVLLDSVSGPHQHFRIPCFWKKAKSQKILK